MTTDQVASAASTLMPPRRVRPLVIVAAAALVVDVLSKIIAVATLEGGDPVRLLGGLLYLRLIRNPGAAFSLGTGLTWLFSLVMIAVSLAICWMAFRLRHTGWAIGLGLVLAGALGNLTDRLFRGPGPFRGHVVDFISLFSANGHPWPIFNIADASINIGGAIVVIMALRGINYDGSTSASRRAVKDAADAPPAEEDTTRPEAKPGAAEIAERVRAAATARANAPTTKVAPVTPPRDPDEDEEADLLRVTDEEQLSGDLPVEGTTVGRVDTGALAVPPESTSDTEEGPAAEPPTNRLPSQENGGRTAVVSPATPGDDATTLMDLAEIRAAKDEADKAETEQAEKRKQERNPDTEQRVYETELSNEDGAAGKPDADGAKTPEPPRLSAEKKADTAEDDATSRLPVPEDEKTTQLPVGERDSDDEAETTRLPAGVTDDAEDTDDESSSTAGSTKRSGGK